MPASLRVTQTRSTISHIARNRATIRALGLHGIGSSSILPDNPAVRGHGPPGPLPRDRRGAPGGRGRDDPGEALMKIHDLHPAEGSVTKRTRVGRGIAAGKGKTAGRGTKGQRRARARRSRPGSRAARPRSTSGSRSSAASATSTTSSTRSSTSARSARRSRPASSRSRRARPVTVNADTLKQAGPGPSRPPAAQGARQRRRRAPSCSCSPTPSPAARGRRSRPPAAPPRSSRSRPARSRPSGSTSPPTRRPPSREAAPAARGPRPSREGRPRRPTPRRPRPTRRAAAPPSRPPSRPRGRRRARDARGGRRGRRGRQRLAPVFEALLNAFRAPDLRRRILFVAGILLVFRLLAHVPIPGVNSGAAEGLPRHERDLRPARPVLGRRPDELLGRGAGREPVHQRLDHHAADDGRRPLAPGAAARG